jgi:hypothetical protein
VTSYGIPHVLRRFFACIVEEFIHGHYCFPGYSRFRRPHTKCQDELIADIGAIQEEFEFKPKDKDVKEIHAGYKKTVLAFSDSVVVNVALKSTMTKLQGTFDPLMSELSGMAFAQGRCVTNGLFLRGGVDLGWWYRSGTILASESLVGAYKTEGAASVPVIALTDKLYTFLSGHGDRRFYSKDIEPANTLLRQHSYEGPKGKVSFWYLDYITVIAESIDWITSEHQRQSCLASPPGKRDRIRAMGHQKNIREWFKAHARQIKLAHARARNDAVRQKYEWLAEYHNEIAPRFTLSPQALCKLPKHS